jgi:hypothetical protein
METPCPRQRDWATSTWHSSIQRQHAKGRELLQGDLIGQVESVNVGSDVV